MALKGVEEAAAKMLKSTLDKLHVRSEWRPGEDPPDLVFQVEGREMWAVEVTELHQYLRVGKKIKSRAAVTKPLIEMCNRVQAEVSDEMNREYLIWASGPIKRTPLREVERRAVAYVRSGRSDEERLDEEGHVRIQTIKSRVRVSWAVSLDARSSSASGSMIADVRANIEFALERALAAKVPTLAGLTSYNRKMLLIWRDYLFADPEILKELLSARGLTREEVDTVLFATEDEIHWVADPGGVFT